MNPEDPSLKDIRKEADIARDNAVEPSIVETQDQADSMNMDNIRRGLNYRWSVGDKYYTMEYDGNIRGFRADES